MVFCKSVMRILVKMVKAMEHEASKDADSVFLIRTGLGFPGSRHRTLRRVTILEYPGA